MGDDVPMVPAIIVFITLTLLYRLVRNTAKNWRSSEVLWLTVIDDGELLVETFTPKYDGI